MTSRFFKVFCDMLDRTPVRVVLPIAKAECQMMEDDIAHQRLTPDQDIASVLSFCRFLSTGRADGEEASNVLPLDHFAFYRNTVERRSEEHTSELQSRF